MVVDAGCEAAAAAAPLSPHRHDDAAGAVTAAVCEGRESATSALRGAGLRSAAGRWGLQAAAACKLGPPCNLKAASGAKRSSGETAAAGLYHPVYGSLSAGSAQGELERAFLHATRSSSLVHAFSWLAPGREAR